MRRIFKATTGILLHLGWCVAMLAPIGVTAQTAQNSQTAEAALTPAQGADPLAGHALYADVKRYESLASTASVAPVPATHWIGSPAGFGARA